eukprot:Colp12_sorted_trinity150504_noHs@6445
MCNMDTKRVTLSLALLAVVATFSTIVLVKWRKRQTGVRRPPLKKSSGQTVDITTLVATSEQLSEKHVSALVNQLKVDELPAELAAGALVSIANAAAFSNHQNVVRTLGGLDAVMSHLSSEDLAVRLGAVNALSNLSVNYENQRELLQSIPVLARFLKDDDNRLVIAASRALMNLAVTDVCHGAIKSSGAIDNLMRLLENPSTDVQLHSLRALVNMSSSSIHHKQLESSMSVFVSMFQQATNNGEIISRLLIILNNLMERNRCTNLLRQPGVRDMLQALMSHEDEYVRNFAGRLYKKQ